MKICDFNSKVFLVITHNYLMSILFNLNRNKSILVGIILNILK